MRIAGIIAEYNPFHNGHQYHLKTTKRELNADYCVVVMSGNFVQRGEPAIIHKWKRAEMCLSGGADLVIELPVHYAVSSAEFFAEGAIKLLNSINADYLSFGAECPSVSDFLGTLNCVISESGDYKEMLKSSLSKGNSFPRARAEALAQLSGGRPEIYEMPNNILAIEYLKALSKTGSSIVPHIIKRLGAEHNSNILSGRYSSASSIRNAIRSGNLSKTESSLPTEAYRILSQSQNVFPIDIDSYSDMLLYKIKTEAADTLREIYDVTEGLENRIVAASDNDSIRSIISQIKTKRYTFTKIQRILIHILLDITSADIDALRASGPPYIRVIGFKKEAAPLLKRIAEISSLPVVVNLKKDVNKLNESSYKILQKEISSTDIYFSKCHEKALRRRGAEFSFPIVTI